MYGCADIEDCRKNKGLCSDLAICVKKEGTYKCKCKRGFSGDGKVCTGK